MTLHLVPREQLEIMADRIRLGNKGGKITGIGACVFAGGFSHGMEQGGIEVCGHLELPDLALGSDVSAQRWPVVVAPLDEHYEHQNRQHAKDPTTWKSVIQYLQENDAVPRVVYCNPPCAAYAKQGARGGIEDDANMCYTRYCAFSLCMELKPDIWVWELVPGIFEDTEGGGRAFLDDMAAKTQAAGYQVDYFLTTSAIHGGFQNRPRFHFVATKVGIAWQSVYDSDDDEHKGWRTLGECLDRLNRWMAENGEPPNHEKEEKLVGGSLLDIVPFCPPGAYLREVHDEVMTRHYTPRGRPWDGTSRAGVTQVRGRRDRTSPVIVGGQTVIHPEKDRFLTIRENAAVQGFPYDYRFSHGSKGYQEVGKGLCTHNARMLGRAFCHALAAGVAPDLKTVNVIDWRDAAKVPSQSATPQEREAWWKVKHPNLPLEWCHPREKRGPGRPPGSRSRRGPRKSVEGPKTVMFLHVDEALKSTVEKMGFETRDVEDLELPDQLGVAGQVDCVVVRGPTWKNRYFMFVGAALAQGTRIVFYDMVIPSDLPEHPSIVRSDVKEATKVGPLIAQTLGMSAEDVLQKMFAGQDAASLLAKLLSGAA